MKKSTIKILMIELFILISLVLCQFVFDWLKIKEYGIAVTIGIASIASIIALGYAKNKKEINEHIVISVIMLTFLYQVAYFVVFGILTGFTKNVYILSVERFFVMVLPMLLIIVTTEFLRHQILVRGNSNRLLVVSTVILFTIVDTFIGINSHDISTAKGIFELISLEVFPSLTENVLLTFICYNFESFIPGLWYKIIAIMPKYYLPLYPSVDNYLTSTINITVPFLLLLYYYNLIEEKKRKEKEYVDENKGNVITNILVTVVTIFMVVSVYLSCGLFKYSILVIGSGSMEPYLHKGDMIIIEKVKDYSKIKKDDVLVFKADNKIIVHRVIGIENINDTYLFQTKGDNNNVEDSWDTKPDQIVGVSKARIKKAGKITIKLGELFGGE